MKYDVATAICKGERDYQEDSVVADFNQGSSFGFAVLADGMGGHAGGDVASKIVVTEVFSELKLAAGDPAALERDITFTLTNVADGANACINAHVAENPDLLGMGSTLVAPVIFENRLYWISIGDSPLFLFRDGKLRQLNADHSMAPQIDLMVKTGQLDADAARDHPERNSLMSVVMGRQIPMIDCRTDPEVLNAGDLVIVASDGLQFLDNEEISAVLLKVKSKHGFEIAEALIEAVGNLGDPEQDNVSVVVIKLRK